MQYVQEDGREREERGAAGSGEIPLLLSEGMLLCVFHVTSVSSRGIY